MLSQKIDEASGKASEQAAEVTGTNHQYVSDAKRIAIGGDGDWTVQNLHDNIVQEIERSSPVADGDWWQVYRTYTIKKGDYSNLTPLLAMAAAC